jgi:hypothetical protein
MHPPKEYKAGFCNIGEKEIRLRKKLLVLFIGAALFFSVCFLFYHDLLAVLLLAFFSSAISFLVIMEIRKRFCILFGIFRFYNFGRLGHLDHVECKESTRKDRLTAMRMIMYSFLFAAIYVKLIFFICILMGME